MKNNVLIMIILDIQKKLHKSKKNHRFIKFFYKLGIQLIYGGFLPINAELGDNIIFPHGLNGIFISGSAKIGSNCTIYQHITIGSNEGGAPTIKDNCVMGVGVKIIGPITIGNNCKIGAGTVITIDIPDNCTVFMPKPKVILKKLE